MDDSRSPDTIAPAHLTATPRGLYFKAEDRAHWKTHPSVSAKPLPDRFGPEVTRRNREAAKVIDNAQAVINAVKVLRALDETGHTLAALPHIRATLRDLVDAGDLLVVDVEIAAERWQKAQPEGKCPSEALQDVLAEIDSKVVSKEEARQSLMRDGVWHTPEITVHVTAPADEPDHRPSPADLARRQTIQPLGY